MELMPIEDWSDYDGLTPLQAIVRLRDELNRERAKTAALHDRNRALENEVARLRAGQ